MIYITLSFFVTALYTSIRCITLHYLAILSRTLVYDTLNYCYTLPDIWHFKCLYYFKLHSSHYFTVNYSTLLNYITFLCSTLPFPSFWLLHSSKRQPEQMLAMVLIKNKLHVPQSSIELGDCSFCIGGPNAWNSLLWSCEKYTISGDNQISAQELSFETIIWLSLISWTYV